MSTAVTPLFRLLYRDPQPPDDGAARFPSAIPGQCRPESWFMAILTFGVVATAAADLTGGIPWWILRLPLMGLLCFLLPHVVMMGIAALIPPRGKAPSVRQAWTFLALVTAFAALRVRTGGASSLPSAVWLAAAALNALALPFTKPEA